MDKMNEQHPQVLLFANEDFIYGLNRHYYPDVEKQVGLGNLRVESLSNSSKYNLDHNPIGDGSDMYIYNKYKYCGIYLKSTSSDLLKTLIVDQSIAVQEAFIRMGAKHITICEETTDEDKTSIDVNSDTGYKSVGVRANAHILWDKSVDIKSKIEFQDNDNHPSTIDEVERFLNDYGLIGDAKLEMLFGRLKERRTLSGKEKYEVSYLSEVDNTINVALAINAVIFSEKLDFSHEHNHKYSIKKVIEVAF